MRKGDVVKIYQDPLTKQQPEGEAKLIKRLGYGENKLPKVERWEVKFLSDGYITERTIMKEVK